MFKAQRWRPYLVGRVGLFAVALLIIFISMVRAVELPPDGSAAFIQTSGPNTPITIGDYYTSFQGQQGVHFVRARVPCTWPDDLPVTFALFDPEVREPDPDTSQFDPPFADDEIRDPNNNTIMNPPTENIQFADTTTYTLFAIRDNGQLDRVVGPVTFVPTTTVTNTTNGRWVELVTFTPSSPNFGCGRYALASETSDNDDNAWKLSVSHDPDCTVSVSNPGSCSGIGQDQSDLLSNGNSRDSADGEIGTGDELVISLDQISYQHEGAGTTCQLFYHPVYLPDLPEIVLHNFDLDINAQDPGVTVRHFSPTGDIIEGEASDDTAWNLADTPPPFPPQRGGNVIPVTRQDVGLWVTEICVVRDNQYIFEAQEDEVVFLKPPPIPIMDVSKDDGRIVVEPDDVLTYTVVFTNISDTNPFPLPPPANAAPPGAAFNVRLKDELPPFTTFVSCGINPPFTGTCDESPTGFVNFRLNEIIKAGDGGTVLVTARVDADAPPGLLTDTIVLSYTGLLQVEFPPITDTDIDVIVPQPTETPAPAPTATPDDDDDDDGDDDDGGSSQPTPPPPPPASPPTSTAVPGEASVASEPTPTPAVLFLPETGNRNPLTVPTLLGIIALLAVLSVALVLWQRRLTRRGHN